ncbi:hypothetical protein [Streptomyces orinoci]|uniref:Uncharacterized protein n=1 Tax=Streptomyces orinoci TaxID=67339 RepID=A0ABV3K259_STRON|nr:hypothetical protein [Streptomyces orinoci]
MNIKYPTVIAGALLALATSTGVASAETECSTSPVGVWSGTVKFKDQTSPIDVSFGKDGAVCLETPVSVGQGTWVKTGGQTFTYVIKETFKDGSGMSGWVSIDQNAVLNSSKAFTSSGLSKVYDASGNQVGTTAATTEATRKSYSAPGCHK